MKAAVLTEPYKIVVQEVEKPAPQAGEVLVKIRKAGICGSEIHAFKGMHPKRKPPVILGHELVGVIEALGPDVQDFQVGERVTVEPQVPCLRCEDCVVEDFNLCKNKRILGTKKWPGSFEEYITAPTMVLYRIPEQVSDLSAVMIEPLSVAVHSVRKSGTFSGKTALIIGAGTIGLLALQVGKEYGFERIIVTDILDHSLQLAKKLGADLTLNPQRENVVEEALKFTGGHGADVVLMTAGNQRLMDDALASVANKGLILPITHFPGDDVSIKTSVHRYKEVVIAGTVMYTRKDILEAIRLLAEGFFDVEQIITHQLSLDEVGHGIEMVDKKLDKAIKVILDLE